MKKIFAAILVLALALCACAFAEEEIALGNDKSEGVMTYAEYMAAEIDAPVVIEAYVQATQSWYQDKITVYAADEDGAYFIYNMACSEADAANLIPGTKIRVEGFKAEWSGEIEIAEGATFEFEEAEPFFARPVDVTGLLGTDALAEKMNQLVSFKGMTVEPSKIEGDDADYAFLYNWDGSGEAGTDSDLYFNVSKDGVTYTFTVEYYLCNENTEAYQAVTALEIGQVVDLEGFLYWYNGANPHITNVIVAE